MESEEDYIVHPKHPGVTRFNQLADKLKYLNITPQNHELIGKTIDEVIDNFNKASNGKFEIIGRKKYPRIKSESQDLWISVSIISFKECKEKYLDYIKFIEIKEHSGYIGISRSQYDDKRYSMGISQVQNTNNMGEILTDSMLW